MTSQPAIADISAAEKNLRCDLAACYRLVAHFGWDDMIATHISVRIPGEDSFLINPFGMLFDEIRPADLVKVDLEGNVLMPTKWAVNKAGFVIHSAIHRVRHDVLCAMHLHTDDGIAVSMVEDGLLPLHQLAMLLDGDIAFHEYEGVAFDLAERERLVADLGEKKIMFLRNHGTLTLGSSVAEAFTLMYLLEKSCTAQVRALSMGLPLHPVSDDVVAKVSALRMTDAMNFAEELLWPAMLRKLDRLDPSWRG
jgi:ribulose-5-phosphate 4-epimerase/fuculose-1-phosphate aldolase